MQFIFLFRVDTEAWDRRARPSAKARFPAGERTQVDTEYTGETNRWEHTYNRWIPSNTSAAGYCVQRPRDTGITRMLHPINRCAI